MKIFEEIVDLASPSSGNLKEVCGKYCNYTKRMVEESGK